jgi:hypothetical protein
MKKQVAKETPAVEPEVKEEKKYVLREHQIDQFTIKRWRVELTPCVCESCGFDFCERNNFPAWDEQDPGTQAVVLKAMEEHKKLHTVSQLPVITESELRAEQEAAQKRTRRNKPTPVA